MFGEETHLTYKSLPDIKEKGVATAWGRSRFLNQKKGDPEPMEEGEGEILSSYVSKGTRRGSVRGGGVNLKELGKKIWRSALVLKKDLVGRKEWKRGRRKVVACIRVFFKLPNREQKREGLKKRHFRRLFWVKRKSSKEKGEETGRVP